MPLSFQLRAAEVVEHDLEVRIDPVAGELEATDRITLPRTLVEGDGGSVNFLLHDALHPVLLDDAGGERALKPKAERQGYSHYRISFPVGEESVTIRYRGNLGAIDNDDGGKVISAEGVQLSGNTLWYPEFGDLPVRFQLKVNLPAGWLAVSQGARVNQWQDGDESVAVWREAQPQRQIWLVADRFREYGKSFAEAEAMAFLLQPDGELAERYLDATGEYLKLYSELIGPYPYAKFALVENRQQTGYGMPSFTLIGSRVMRLPFLLQSSYPHEILHNWWGNGVYVDYGKGNWSEGLTAYLADHLLAERQERGAVYRRAALQKYADYVSAGQDFPLRDFRSRHGDASMAVGYSKSLMFFHDLRQRLGDEEFFKALRNLYATWRFKTASWDAVRASFEETSGQDLQTLFEQWLERSGAPLLTVSDVAAHEKEGQYRLTGTLLQQQESKPFDLLAPMRVTLESDDRQWSARIRMNRNRQAFDLALPARPLRLEVDPDYDLFRRLHPEELPPSLGQVFGAEKITAVLPAEASTELREGMRTMVKIWRRAYPHIEVVFDSELAALPEEGTLWLLGWNNRFLPRFKGFVKAHGAVFHENSVSLPENDYAREAHSIIVAARRHVSGDPQPVAWLGCHDADALAGLGRKVTHYGRYSYLAFTGSEPRNVLKGEWRGSASPLKFDFSVPE
ncbi:MAG: M1 family aminopeptidase [Pseudomonadota bacterium]|nr:M1 family aminopeptidase [Pseudomonadota bacterium]